ncbi:uncharacterized protein [Littorina saxatilis]|uniref:uncharacterized protein n=1 Tax=Littorina saxatilis TaxID=31220 RepID=UPI0038B41ACA
MSGRGRPRRATQGKRPARLQEELPRPREAGNKRQRQTGAAASSSHVPSSDSDSQGAWFEEAEHASRQEPQQQQVSGIMLVGSSLITRLQQHLDRSRQDLRSPLPVLLAGQPGLGFPQAHNKLLSTIRGTPPHYLVLHVGANDIARVDQKQWLQELDELVCFIRAYYPAAILVWSDMLPRLAWRHAHTLQGAENLRRRLNRRARGRILKETAKSYTTRTLAWTASSLMVSTSTIGETNSSKKT